MGSVLDIIECPNCKQEAFVDFYYKTGEEYIFCENCGYRRSAYIQNRDKALNELTDDDWVLAETRHPFGAYRCSLHNNIGYQCGTLENEEEYLEFKNSMNIDPQIDYASVSRFIDGEIKTEIIINNQKTEENGQEDNR